MIFGTGVINIVHDEASLFDKIKNARHFAKMVTNNSLRISFLLRGKGAITLGSDAKPTQEFLLTSGDVKLIALSKQGLEKKLGLSDRLISTL